MTPKRTGATPKIIDGVTFVCWQEGVCMYRWRSEDGRLCAWANYSRSTYSSSLDDRPVGNSFRSLQRAMEAAVKLFRQTALP